MRAPQKGTCFSYRFCYQPMRSLHVTDIKMALYAYSCLDHWSEENQHNSFYFCEKSNGFIAFCAIAVISSTIAYTNQRRRQICSLRASSLGDRGQRKRGASSPTPHPPPPREVARRLPDRSTLYSNFNDLENIRYDNLVLGISLVEMARLESNFKIRREDGS
ncbi:hypothetical protein OS493_018605 [Desmophyllum pertusum]|uniref:Uncharacterized protein n=1 Tax=Desmophyllum pertusum TaxID=174260 RepID=A0A9W9ZNF4_9CNID|nr:hypothetical protein OS493_018605 [Desmophyllum pertusum]